MVAITSNDDFIQAVNEWRKIHSFQGTPYINAGDRKIFDEIPDPTPEAPGHVRYIDVTPAAAALEAALDAALAAQTAELERATIRDAAADGLRGSKIDLLIDAINDDIAEIDTDVPLLAAATTLPQIKPLVARMMARQKRQAQLTKRLLQVLSHE